MLTVRPIARLLAGPCVFLSAACLLAMVPASRAQTAAATDPHTPRVYTDERIVHLVQRGTCKFNRKIASVQLEDVTAGGRV